MNQRFTMQKAYLIDRYKSADEISGLAIDVSRQIPMKYLPESTKSNDFGGSTLKRLILNGVFASIEVT